MAAADPVVREPVSRVEATAPADHLGDAMRDPNASRARVQGSASGRDGEPRW